MKKGVDKINSLWYNKFIKRKEVFKMVVWVLSFGECDLAELNGVYSTKEKAVEAFKIHCEECKAFIQNVGCEGEEDLEDGNVSYTFDFAGIPGIVETTGECATITKYVLDAIVR